MIPEQHYAELVEEFVGHPRVTHGADGTRAKRGFGSSALKVDGKIFAMLAGERLVVKLSRGRVEELVVAGDGQRFDPGHGRLMHEWLAVSPSSELAWSALAAEALGFIGPE